MTTTARTLFKVFAAAFTILFVAGAMWPRPAPAPLDLATADDFTLCDAWHQTKRDDIAQVMRARHLLTLAEWSAASNGSILVGMDGVAVTCALGMADTYSHLTTADAIHWTRTYVQPDGRRLIVQFTNGKVTAFGD